MTAQKKQLRVDEAIDATTQTLTNLHSKTIISNTAQVQRARTEKETVQKVLIRTCNAIYQKGVWFNCAGAGSVHTTWSFLEDSGESGALVNAWNGTTTNTFSCGSEGDYGRYLLHENLPSDIVTKYGYDLSDISDTNAYPCGYSEIVYQL